MSIISLCLAAKLANEILISSTHLLLLCNRQDFQ